MLAFISDRTNDYDAGKILNELAIAAKNLGVLESKIASYQFDAILIPMLLKKEAVSSMYIEGTETTVPDVLKNEIDILIRQIGESREKFCYLIEKLKFLNEDSSIEVKKLELKHLDRLGSTFLYLQVNGLYGIDIKHYDTEENYIKDIVERNLR